MNKVTNIFSAVVSTLRRFHMVLFIVTVMAGLTAAILLLYVIVLKTNTPISASADASKSSFDQATISQIEKLKTSDEPSTPLDLSQGRISPFSE